MAELPQDDSPVILSPEETTQVTAEEAATQTLPPGEAEAKTVGELPVDQKTGLRRTTVAPNTMAMPSETEVAPPAAKTVTQIEMEDVAQRKETAATRPSFANWVKNIQTTGTDDMLGDILITPEVVADITVNEQTGELQGDDTLILNLETLYGVSGAAPASKEGPVLPMETAAREFDFAKAQNYPELYSKMLRNYTGRKGIARELKKQNVSDEISQIVVENIDFSVSQQVAQRLAEAGRFTGTQIPDFLIMMMGVPSTPGKVPESPTNPVIASIMESGSLPGTDAFNAEYAVQSEKFRKNYIDFEGWVRDNVPAATLAQYYNESIHGILEEKFEGEQYDNLAFEKDQTGQFLVDDKGNKIKKDFITEDAAYNINDLTFNSLNNWEKFSVLGGEEGFYGLLTGGASIVGGAQRIKSMQRAAQSPKYKNLLQGITDPETIQQTLVQYDKRFKADRFFDAGLAQYRTNSELRSVNTRIAEIRDQLDNLNNRPEAPSQMVDLPSPSGKGVVSLTKQDHTRRLTAELKQLTGVRNRAFLSGRLLPYAKDATETSLAIAAVTAVFRENGPFDSPDTNEAFGNIFASLGGYRPVLYGARNLRSKGAVAGASRLSGKVAMPFTMIRNVVASIPVAGPILVDKTLENMEQFLGRTMSEVERRHTRTIVEFYKTLKPADRADALRSQAETFNLIDRFASRYDTPAKQEKARELMINTYEHTSGILTLVAAGQLNSSKSLDLKALSKYDIKDMEENLKAQQNLITLAEDALEQLTGMTAGIDSVANREIIEGWVRARRQGLENIKNEIVETRQQRLKSLDNLQDYIINFGDNGLDDGTIASLISYRGALTDSLGEILDKNLLVKSMDKSINNRIDGALKSAKRLRNQTGHTESVNKLIETFNLGHDASIRAKGDAIYDDARKFAETIDPLDIKPLVQELAAGRGIDGIRRFLGPESELFFGSAGEKAREAFENILHSSFSATDMADMRNQLLNKAIKSKASGREIDRIRKSDDLDLAIAMMERNPDFNPFKVANPYDLELMRRAFKRTADSYAKEGKSDLAYQFGNFADKLDVFVEEANPQWSEKISAARKEYEAIVGVPTTPTMYLDKLFSMRERRLPATLAGEKGGMSLRNIYRDKFEPIQMFDEFGKAVSDVMMPGAKGRPADLQNAVEKLVYSYGTYKNGKYVFDASTPEGAQKLEQFRDVMREVLYSKMGRDFFDKYKKVKSKTRPTALAGQSGYEFMQDMDKTMEAMTIPIDYGDGKIVREPIVDMMDAVDASMSLQRAIKEQPLVRKAYDGLKDRFKAYKKTSTEQIKELERRELEGAKLLENIAGDLSAKDFVDRYILSGEGGGIQMLKNAVTQTAKAAGKDPKAAVEDFQKIATIYTIQGIYELAGVQAVGGKVIREAGDEGKLVAKQIQSPENALLAMEDPATRKAMDDLLGEDATLFLEDMLRVMNESTHVVRASTQTNDYKGITEAGVVSRLWNGVKGFVSPVYIATEYMITAAKAGQISLMKLAVQDKEAAIILHKMIANPNLMTTQEFSKFEQIAENYLFTELAMQGQEMMMTGEEMPIEEVIETAVPVVGEAVVKRTKQFMGVAKEMAVDTGKAIQEMAQ
jgi:hypothetical protein